MVATVARPAARRVGIIITPAAAARQPPLRRPPAAAASPSHGHSPTHFQRTLLRWCTWCATGRATTTWKQRCVAEESTRALPGAMLSPPAPARPLLQLLGAAAYKKTSLMDAKLDETGRSQASTLGMRIREAHMVVDVVLVSPLTRTLETATHMFPDRRVPFVAVELCREAHGGHPCDQRRPISVVKKEFTHVDFSGVATDEDTWHNPDRRETVREVAIRCDKFLMVLRARPERNLVVVSHGVFLETLLNRCGLFCTDDSLRLKRFENAEMRSIVLGGWMP